MLRRIAVVCFVLGFVLHGRAQEQEVYINGSDTLHYTYTPLPGQEEEPQAEKRPPFLRRVVKYFEGSTTDRTFEKKIDFTFAGGPSYSKNTSLGIGLLAAGLYRIDRTDSVTAPSDISIFANVSISGFYALGVTGNNIFARNSKRIDYTVMFASAPRDMWGIGYHDGRYNEEGSYNEKRYLVKGRYLHRVLPSTYVGGILSPNPYRGIYVSLEETFYAKGLGNCGKSLWRTTFTADWYRQVWKGGLIATDLYAEFNSEGTPWPMLARMGGSQRMRGYYQGRYTDNDMITFQVELRQRIWRRIGCTVWGGAGNVFNSLDRFDWSETLPNYGVGLRWELKKRVNVRLDYGFGKKTSGFLLSLNEAF